jgi:hypothetical protein
LDCGYKKPRKEEAESEERHDSWNSGVDGGLIYVNVEGFYAKGMGPVGLTHVAADLAPRDAMRLTRCTMCAWARVRWRGGPGPRSCGPGSYRFGGTMAWVRRSIAGANSHPRWRAR